MKKTLSLVLAGILGTLISMGNVKAADAINWTDANSLPSASGNYQLGTDVAVNDSWIINNKSILIDLNGHKIVFNSEKNASSIVLTGGTNLTINGTVVSDNENITTKMATFATLKDSGTNILNINDTTINAPYNGIVLEDKDTESDEEVHINNSTINNLYPSNATIIFSYVHQISGKIITTNSPGFNLGYLLTFDNDNTKGTITYNNLEVGAKEGLLYTTTYPGNEFTITPKDNYKIDNVTITDNEGNEILYGVVDNKYTFAHQASSVNVSVEYVKDNSANVSNDTVQNNDNINNKQENGDTKDDKKTSNPKTSDMIVPTLVISILSLVGLDLLVLIKKRFN